MAILKNSILGHDQVWELLQRQRRMGQLPHALAFCGPSGIGKRKMATALAQALLCENAETAPCGECGPCRRVALQQSEGLLLVEPQNGVIKIESARAVLDFFQLRQLARARVVIVDEAQTLNPQAANTLLKIVEEPPAQAFLIFTVSEVSQLLPTLRSRLQKVRFAPLDIKTLRHLQGQAEDWQLKASRGSLQRLDSFSQTEARTKAFDFLQRGLGGAGGLDEFLELSKEREALPLFIHFTQELLRDWLVPENERVHTDLSSALSAWPERTPQTKMWFWRQAFQMEVDVASHVDRGLVLQNFFSQLRHEVS